MNYKFSAPYHSSRILDEVLMMKRKFFSIQVEVDPANLNQYKLVQVHTNNPCETRETIDC